MTAKLELNIALIPNDSLANQHIKTSQKLAKLYPALVQLHDVSPRLALPPHLTLYQAPLPVHNLDKLLSAASEIAQTLSIPDIKATTYSYNAGEASFELQYETTDILLAWQNAIIQTVNPLRDSLIIERDPGGNVIADLLQSEGILGENLRRTGYGEVGDAKTGGLFRPHVTLNWFELGTEVDEQSLSLQSLATMSGTFPLLGVYLLGPHGTCPQRIALYQITSNA
jgi:hypothetical protein